MNRELWTRRSAALGVIACTIVSLIALTGLVDDLGAVRSASVAEADALGAPVGGGLRWVEPKPVIRAANPKIAIDEYLNGQLGPLGLTLLSITPSSVRSLGGGLKLAEVRIEARTDGSAAQAVAQWAAVNREAVRMKSFSMGVGADGEGVVTIVLLMVIA